MDKPMDKPFVPHPLIWTKYLEYVGYAPTEIELYKHNQNRNHSSDVFLVHIRTPQESYFSNDPEHFNRLEIRDNINKFGRNDLWFCVRGNLEICDLISLWDNNLSDKA